MNEAYATGRINRISQPTRDCRCNISSLVLWCGRITNRLLPNLEPSFFQRKGIDTRRSFCYAHPSARAMHPGRLLFHKNAPARRPLVVSRHGCPHARSAHTACHPHPLGSCSPIDRLCPLSSGTIRTPSSRSPLAGAGHTNQSPLTGARAALSSLEERELATRRCLRLARRQSRAPPANRPHRRRAELLLLFCGLFSASANPLPAPVAQWAVYLCVLVDELLA